MRMIVSIALVITLSGCDQFSSLFGLRAQREAMEQPVGPNQAFAPTTAFSCPSPPAAC
jgi:hypothetical protein